MDSAKRALLDRLIDDASLFPPAQLPMRQALRAHARHNESAYAFIGGRFVLAASRIDEFTSTRQDGAIDVSVILDAGSAGAKGDTVRADLHRVERLRALDGVTVGGLEIKLSAVVDAVELRRVVMLVGEGFQSDVSVWYELAYAGGWAGSLDDTLAALAFARTETPDHVMLGAKIRCGGAVVPSVDDVAAFIVAAHRHRVPWKATAGLHHPVRGGNAHGFLNLFVAGCALNAEVLPEDRVAAVVAEEDARNFVVDPTHVAWRDAQMDADAVAAGRGHCVAFGSCSFDEPVNDLRALGILS